MTRSRSRRVEVITLERATKSPATSLVHRTRQRRSELIVSELEAVALAMFKQRGFAAVTVEEIAAEAQTSKRTFYRHFPVKEDVLQVRIRRRAEAIRDALAERPSEEPPLRSLRVALQAAMSAEDPVLVGRWIDVVAATPSVLMGVVGGCVLVGNKTMAEFLGSRLGLPGDALLPAMLAAATGGIIQAAETRWRFHGGGDLATIVSEGMRALEEGVGGDLGTSAGGNGRGNKNNKGPARSSKPT
jgi:AcrR family transcriptional regulator